jgi:hypothetical protein
MQQSPNGTHQRPHADASARERGRLVNARTLIARGQALYVSRLAAWVCSASDSEHKPQALIDITHCVGW